MTEVVLMRADITSAEHAQQQAEANGKLRTALRWSRLHGNRMAVFRNRRNGERGEMWVTRHYLEKWRLR